MKNNEMPESFEPCFANDEQCFLANCCLRRQVASSPIDASRRPVVTMIDPRYVETLDGKACSMFVPNGPQSCRRGMSHLFDRVPAHCHRQVRRAVQQCFTNRSFFYDAKAGKRLITPVEQRAIARVFRHYSLPFAPHYDKTEEAVIYAPE